MGEPTRIDCFNLGNGFKDQGGMDEGVLAYKRQALAYDSRAPGPDYTLAIILEELAIIFKDQSLPRLLHASFEAGWPVFKEQTITPVTAEVEADDCFTLDAGAPM